MSTLQTYNLKHPDASGNQITFTSGGLVGVGTSAPGTGTSSYYDDLVVKNDTAGTGAGITIQSNSTNGFSGLDLRTAGGTEIAKIAASAATSKLSIDAGGSTAITIDSSQQVGIGNASPTAKLQVESTSDQLKLTYPSVASYIHEVDSSGNYAIAKDSIEALRIDSSGRLLLGGSSSAKDYKLVVRNNAGTDGFEGGIFLQRATTPPASATGGHGLGTIVFGAAPTGDENEAAQIVAKSDGTWGVNDWPSRLEFYTTPDGSNVMTERMRITNTGFIRHVSTENGLDIGSTQGAGTTYILMQGVRSRTGIGTGGGAVIRIYTNGNVENTNNSYGALSDIKLKENIVDANSQWEDIKQVQVRNYNLIEGETHTQIGVVAQEIETVSPGLVYESPDRDEEGNDLGTATKSVNYSVLYMKAVKALQEAMERIETLEQRLSDAGIA